MAHVDGAGRFQQPIVTFDFKVNTGSAAALRAWGCAHRARSSQAWFF
jgi:hypothetical protein